MRSFSLALPTAAVATALLVAGCGSSSSSGSTATVPAGDLGAAVATTTTPAAPRRALVLQVSNNNPWSATLSDDADPTNAKKEWSYPLGKVRGRTTEAFVRNTTALSTTVKVTYKTELAGGKAVQFTFESTLSCSGNTCGANGRLTSPMPDGLKVTFSSNSSKFLSPQPAGGEGALDIVVDPTS